MMLGECVVLQIGMGSKTVILVHARTLASKIFQYPFLLCKVPLDTVA